MADPMLPQGSMQCVSVRHFRKTGIQAEFGLAPLLAGMTEPGGCRTELHRMRCSGLLLNLSFGARGGSMPFLSTVDGALYDLYESRQILLPPSSDTSSDPSGSCSKPTGRPQTSRFSGASMNPVKNSFGPPCGLPPLNGMKATE